MKRLERLTALLSFLQSHRYSRIAELMDKFEVSERTLYRDLRSLDEAGIPLGHDPDRGYYILETYHLPPLAFTEEEAKCFVLLGQMAKKYFDRHTLGHFTSGLDKIKVSLKTTQLERMERLEQRVRARVDEHYLPKHLGLIQEACDERLVLQLEYEDRHGQRTQRQVEPIGMTFYGQGWHMITYCRLRQDYRDFDLVRIQSLVATDDRFGADHITLQQYIERLENSQTT